MQEQGLGQGRGVPGACQFSPQAGGTGLAPIAAALGQGMLGHAVEQGLGGILRIRHQRDFRRVVAHGLVRVDVDPQQRPGNLEAAGEGHVVIGFRQLGADRQHHIGVRHQGTGGHQGLGRADQQGVLCRQHAFGIDGQGHRRVQQLGQAGQLGGGINRAATGENQRTLGVCQPLTHLRHGRRRGTRASNAHWLAIEQEIGVFHQHVEGNLDVHRTRAPGLEQGESPGQHARQLGGRHQRMRERCHTRHQGTLVRQFVQLATTTAQLAARLHAGDHQHRDRVSIGLAHGGGDIGHAGTGDDEAHPGFAAGAGIAVGHEPGALFVARRDVVDARTGQPAIQLNGVDPGNAEYLLDPVAFE